MLLIGSFLIFVSIIILSYNSFINLKEEVYSDFKLKNSYNYTEKIVGLPFLNNLTKKDVKVTPKEAKEEIDYSKYIGVLEIPNISLKRGFYSYGNKLNTIEHNVTVVGGSDMPDVNNGNLILMAHSGDAYISFFAYLYKLNIGNYIYVSYGGVKYTYKLVNKYDVMKTGFVDIKRNDFKKTITLITCTKNNDSSQTIYIGEEI